MSFVGQAQAQAQSPSALELPPAALKQALTLAEQAARSLAPAGARIEAEAGSLDARLRLAPCTRIDPFPAPGAPAWGRTRVGLRCSEGASAWRVYLPVTVHVWAPAVVSTVALAAGTMLIPGQLKQAEADWADGSGSATDDLQALAGRQLVQPVAAGQVLRSTDLRPRQHFSLGDTVRIEATGDGFSVVAEGQALSPGLEGQPARVRTDNGRVLVGRPVGDNRIEVRL
ncbi:MAG: flagellar basal body P-ring formation chaperone FlgA [Rubrivivax sp.]